MDEYFEKQKQKEYEARLDEEEQKVIRELDEYLSFEGIFLPTAQVNYIGTMQNRFLNLDIFFICLEYVDLMESQLHL